MELRKLMALAIIFTTVTGFSQRIRFDEDKISFLKHTDTVSVYFTYKDLRFNADSLTETEFKKYIYDKIVKHANGNVASEFLRDLDSAKQNMWPKMFVETLNERSLNYDNSPIFTLNNDSAKYAIHLNVDWMYFGYDVTIIDAPAKVSMGLFFEENGSKTIIEETQIRRAYAQYSHQKGDGDVWPRPSLHRMEMAFKKAAYKLAQSFRRVVK